MGLWVLVPVKPLRRGKSRLSGVLTEEQRTMLNYSLLVNTLRTLSVIREIDNVLVVSRDTAALSLARDFGFRTLQEDDEGSDLNMALTRATVVAQYYGATSIFVLPADLPLLKPLHIQDMLRKAHKPPMLMVVPDRREEGTNALYISPIGIIEYQFGPDSFKKHTAQAEARHIPVEVVDIESLKLDLDIPEDLEELHRIDNTLFYTIP